MRKRFKSLQNQLQEPVDGASVAFIRVAFAATMVIWLTMHLVLDKIAANYYEPGFLFPYFGFDWLQPWPGRGLHLHFVITLIASLGMLMGVFYRFSSILFAIGFIYIAMLDKATYQNHYYLFCLLAILFAITPADRAFSLDVFRRKLPPTIPRWVVWLFQFQIGLVYFFGGVAKMNADWLQGFPMQMVLASKQDHLIIGPFCQEPWFIYAFSWSGLLLDLLIVPLLVWSRTRPLAFLLTLAFHLMNASLFPIGVFPWAMIFLTTIFFAPDWPRRLVPSFFKSEAAESLRACPKKGSDPLPGSKRGSDPFFGQAPSAFASANNQRGWGSTVLHGFVIGFVMLQILLPFRHFAYAEDTSWTERNHHFSWHMMLRGKISAIRFYAIDRKTGEWAICDLRPHLRLHQLKRMGGDPFMIRDFARFIQKDYEKHGVPNVMVRAFVLCSLNGRKPQLLIDPNVDLTQENLPSNWIVPLEADIGGTWDRPVAEWEDLVMQDPIHAQLFKSNPPSGTNASRTTTTSTKTISTTDNGNSPAG